ncbi:tumor necrosis factor receptor superfamily member 5-like [Brachyhypopomus gauderio]|uniref:tumor necrosis factor receptor superfamily member 5-like n=1 Tax=Brachyhypopomus gauderio TaxID=698409 RepID=UPI0040431143
MQDGMNLTSTSKISSLEIILIIVAVFLLNLELCVCACARAEYKINEQCCPMCSPGNRVYRHCTDDTSTTCVPCLKSTYTAEPNGREKCLICSVCDPGSGLRVKTQCTRSSDTVCEPLERHYCIDQVRGSCTQAEKHTACSPGHYIQQEGTALKDTVCDVCTAGTYSDGSLQTCQPHSKCEDLGLVEIKPETSSTDAECGKQTSVAVTAGIITGVVVVVLMVVAAVGVGVFRKKMYRPVPPAGNHAVRSSADEDKLRSRDSDCEEVVFDL